MLNALLAAACIVAGPAAVLAATPAPPSAPARKPAPRPPPAAEVPLPPPPVPPAKAAPGAATPAEALKVPPPQRLAPGAKGGALRVAVLDTRLAGEVPPRAAAVWNQSLVPEVRKLEGVSAIGMAEIRDMLGFEYQRQMLGCQADDQCLAEIAGALGVDELVTADLVLNGKTYSLSLRRVDLKKARVGQSFNRTLERRDGEELLAMVGPAVAGLFPERDLRPGRTRGVEAATIRRLNPPPLPRWVFWGTGAAAVVALGGAGVSHAMARDARSEYDRLVQGALSVAIPASDLQAAADRVHSRESTRNLLLFTGLGLGAAAGVESLFTDWRDDRKAAGAVAVPLVAPGAGGVALAGRF
jgi:hypothetical protein